MTTKLKNGGPAFPAPQLSDIGACTPAEAAGMSLRDYFAAAAMPMVGYRMDKLNANWTPSQIAAIAYEVADAMLEQRANGGSAV